MVCGLLLALAPCAAAAQNSKDSTQSPTSQKSQKNESQNIDTASTLEKTPEPKASAPASPTGAPNSESKSNQDTREKAGDGKKVEPQSTLSRKPIKRVKPVAKRSAIPELGKKMKGKPDSKNVARNVKSIKKVIKGKSEKNQKADVKPREKVTASPSAASAIKVEDATAVPVPLPTPQSDGLSAAIEKVNGNKATIVVSGVKEGTQVKVLITEKDSKKK